LKSSLEKGRADALTELCGQLEKRWRVRGGGYWLRRCRKHPILEEINAGLHLKGKVGCEGIYDGLMCPGVWKDGFWWGGTAGEKENSGMAATKTKTSEIKRIGLYHISAFLMIDIVS
jgi:hypothetical protein